jgi:hypothetical protein
MKLKLAETKSTFSGRSSAEEIVKSLSPNLINEIDFSGVDSITQSFASEFIRSLITSKFNLEKIVFSNMNERCSSRINTEVVRIKNIYSKLNEL